MSEIVQQILILLSYFLGFLVFLIAIFFAIKYFIKKKKSYLPIFRKTVLLVTVPRESVDVDQEKALSLQNIQEKIGVMETIYANISGLRKSINFKSLFSGPKNHLAFEIVVKNGVILFYIAVQQNLKQFVIQQIQAQYPNAHIEETEDYNIFSSQGFVNGVYLQLNKGFIFPIKSYKNLQSDPLNALINALSKMESDDGAVIQFVVRPAQSNWRAFGSKVISEVRKGKSLKEAVGQTGNSKTEILTSIGGDIGKSLIGPGVSGENKPAVQEIHKMSPMEEESVKKIEEKISKSGLEANIRIIVSADKKDQVDTYLDNIVNSFGQYNIYEYGNSFKATNVLRQKNIINDFIYRNFNQAKKIVLNSEEMASLFHFPLASSQTPNIQWLSSKEAPAPNNIPDTGIVLGENIYRDIKTIIKINRSDRTRHIYAIGKSGTGKSEFLSNMAKQDILNGDGVAVIDPHGDLVSDILDTIPSERIEDVIYFDPSDIERPMGINLLEYNRKYPEQKTFVINEMISIFDKLYDLKQTGGPMFEQYMRNAMLLVMEDPESGSTLMEISKVLADPDFRKYKLSKCFNPVVKDFWQKEAEKAGGDAALANMVPYITSKLNTFISNDIMRPIIGQQESAFDLRTIMDERKILLVNLSKGKIGEMNSYLLGMVLVGKILMSALSRTDIPRNERKDFYLYLDEFQNFITESITVILSEARKYRLNLNIAHQYIGQLSQKQDASIREAIFGNIGTIVSFKIGAEDAEFLSKEFAPVFSAYDLVNIDKFNAYVKLIIDNQPTRAFNMKTFPLQKNKISNADRIKQFSKLKYGNDRSVVEAEILKRAKM